MTEHQKDIKQFKEFLDELLEIRTKKSLDYGHSWKLFGIQGLWYQIGGKFIRLWNLKDKEPKNESLKDTLNDLAIYCLMAKQLLENKDLDDKITKVISNL